MREGWATMALLTSLLVVSGCPATSPPEAMVPVPGQWRFYPSELRLMLAKEGASWSLEVPTPSGATAATGSFDGQRLIVSVQATSSLGTIVRDYDGRLETPSLIQGQSRLRLNDTILLTEPFLAHPLNAD